MLQKASARRRGPGPAGCGHGVVPLAGQLWASRPWGEQWCPPAAWRRAGRTAKKRVAPGAPRSPSSEEPVSETEVVARPGRTGHLSVASKERKGGGAWACPLSVLCSPRRAGSWMDIVSAVSSRRVPALRPPAAPPRLLTPLCPWARVCSGPSAPSVPTPHPVCPRLSSPCTPLKPPSLQPGGSQPDVSRGPRSLFQQNTQAANDS